MSNKKIDLDNITEEELLKFRICDLPVTLEGGWLEDCVNRLYSELESKGIGFKPLAYLADEWLTPDGEPVIGIPFFLAHSSLVKLEKKMMLEAEGHTRDWCMKLLRHETGHAINYAYKLHRRKKWKDVFGHFAQEYADTYKFRPYSKNFVRHLEDYYAQYHPDEDFSETFAVWLTPDLDWRNDYKGWRAMRKLNYVNELMDTISKKEPVVRRGKQYWKASKLKSTLTNYYKKKKRFHAEDFPDFHDSNLKRIFSERESGVSGQSAYELIRRYRKQIVNNVSTWTGEKKYIVDDLVRSLMQRSKSLSLMITHTEAQAMLEISVYITTLIMNYMYTGKLRGNK